MDLDEQLNVVENKIRDLKREYELYFSGEKRRPPELDRRKLQQVLGKLTTEHVANTKLKFRLNSLGAAAVATAAAVSESLGRPESKQNPHRRPGRARPKPGKGTSRRNAP